MTLHIINTGGTFDKVYDEITGEFNVDATASAARKILILARDNINCEITPIIHKDSNYFTDDDRILLTDTISTSKNQNIIIIHGTDTMNKSALFIDEAIPNLQKRVIFVGSMRPYSISKDEAIFNLASAIGFLNSTPPDGIYISMHGLVLPHKQIKKDKERGIFEPVKSE